MLQPFDFSADYVLEDDFVQLRPLKETDYENLLPFALDEPNIWAFSLVAVIGAAGLKNYIQTAIAARKENKEYPFIVFDKRQQKYAGCTRFYDIQLQNQTLQLGFTWYGSQFQGTGLNKHCKFLLLQFAFEQMCMERVEFRADNNNKKSIAAMKSIGCTIEGILRSHASMPNGSRRNTIILSVLKDEWFGTVKEALERKISGK
ncbi:GNAT family protein [uncultured Mucilaginibacter sp.]|uniref:GNAT family N-acetyltransferase n=1 Tax=uncultured Mucilaginibacter sp. TaxID=797541 RepID=UPI002624D893|nr:GNAT family protein [uncultured Mucilaginibacter sp.]